MKSAIRKIIISRATSFVASVDMSRLSGLMIECRQQRVPTRAQTIGQWKARLCLRLEQRGTQRERFIPDDIVNQLLSRRLPKLLKRLYLSVQCLISVGCSLFLLSSVIVRNDSPASQRTSNSPQSLSSAYRVPEAYQLHLQVGHTCFTVHSETTTAARLQ